MLLAELGAILCGGGPFQITLYHLRDVLIKLVEPSPFAHMTRVSLTVSGRIVALNQQLTTDREANRVSVGLLVMSLSYGGHDCPPEAGIRYHETGPQHVESL